MENESITLSSHREVMPSKVNMNFKYLFEKVLQERVFIKLHNNSTMIVDTKIIRFSSLIKQMCSSLLSSTKINLETVSREIFEKIIDFTKIIEWNKELFFFNIKANELHNWYEKNFPIMDQILQTAQFLKINHINEYLKHRSTYGQGETFKTGVNLTDKKSLRSINGLPYVSSQDSYCELNKTKNFLEASPPPYIPGQKSLELMIDLEAIKHNANNSAYRYKFNSILKNPVLNELIDALISDSFWFVVEFFKCVNIKDQKKVSELYKQVFEILKRMSSNYFTFFITICDDGPGEKNDTVFNVFRDFISQSVFYSIYLAFPKSRHNFEENFRNKLTALFTYIYNGINTEKTFSLHHWDLDMGKGNIIENVKRRHDDSVIILPEISDFEALMQKNLKKSDYMPKSKNKTHSIINTTILNTPLYRLYAETNKFETLNLIKPIKFSHRRVMDIEIKEKKHAEFVKYAQDTLALVKKRKKLDEMFINENAKIFNTKIKEVKQNASRIRKEFQDIKTQRVQEYANYCIFLSTK